MSSPYYFFIPNIRIIFLQSELRLEVNFTAELNDTNSLQFKSLARDVEDSLLPPLRNALPSVSAIDVYGFRPGSVIAQYNIILDANATSVSPSQLQSAVTSAISIGNITGLNVDTSFTPTVQGIPMQLSSLTYQ